MRDAQYLDDTEIYRYQWVWMDVETSFFARFIQPICLNLISELVIKSLRVLWTIFTRIDHLYFKLGLRLLQYFQNFQYPY